MTFFYDLNKKIAEIAKPKTQLNEGTVAEKWDTETKVSPEEKGKYAGKTKSELLKSYNALKKSGPHKKGTPEFGRMRELAFAIRAKGDWGKVAEAVPTPGGTIDANATRQYAQQIVKAIADATGATVIDNPGKDGSVQIVVNPTPNNRTVGYLAPAGSDGATVKSLSAAIDPFYRTFRQKGWRFDQPMQGQFTIAVPPQQMAEGDMEEGNAFSKAVADAKKDGIQPGETIKVGGKTYPVKEGKAAKPDYLDLDKDGNRKEPMKKAAKDAKDKNVEEAVRVMGRTATGEPMQRMAKGTPGAEQHRAATAAMAKQARAAGSAMRKDSPVNVGATGKYPGQQVMKYQSKNVQPANVEEGWDDMLKSVEKFHSAKKAGEVERGAKHDIEHTATGRKVTRRVDPQGISVGTDDDAKDAPKRGRGRPAGSGKKMGAKGPSGRSKLMKNEDHDAMPDRGEFDREGDMAKEQLHTIEAAAKELRSILSDEQNLPEWVQSKLTKAMDYVDTARDYMLSQDAESEEEMPIAEKAVSKQQQKFMGMAHAMQKGEKIPGASKELKKVAKTMKPKDVEDFAKTKHKGLPKKKTEEVEETTVAGSVATSTAGPAKKNKGGMTFGKGIYDSLNRELEGMISESMNVSVNMGMGPDGQATKSISINADGEDAEQLAQLLNLAGIKAAAPGHSDCGCGTSPCSCEELDENSPDWPTNTEVIGDDDPYMRRYAGGLNRPKSTGQTTAPVINRDPARGSSGPVAEDTSANLYKEYNAYKKQ